MNRKTFALYVFAIAILCGFAIVRSLFFVSVRPVRTDVVQGFFCGFGMAIVSAEAVAAIRRNKVNGWVTMFGCGLPKNGLLLRAACTLAFPGPINTPQEAMYWTASADGAGRGLSGARSYVLHFPADGFPKNCAFWSVTMGDAGNQFVPNPIHRYSVSDRSGLVPNADGSVDIAIRHDAPANGTSNWLPAPGGGFILWFRVYLPGEDVLSGNYRIPPVMEVE